jgi:hypothetical protein
LKFMWTCTAFNGHLPNSDRRVLFGGEVFLGWSVPISSGSKRSAQESHVQARQAHEFQGVALCHHTIAKPVIEAHFTVLHVVLEVSISQHTTERGSHLGKRKIVRGHDANRALF